MSKHAVETVALNALITAFQQSSDLPAKEVHKLITDVSATAIAVTIAPPVEDKSLSLEGLQNPPEYQEVVFTCKEPSSLDNSEVVIELDNSNS